MDRVAKLVKGNQVLFTDYRDGELWYGGWILAVFSFPVPIADTGSGVFRREDKAITYMRWIRKHIETTQAWEKERSLTVRKGASG